MDRVAFPEEKCHMCGGEFTFCYLIDLNGNRHFRIRCEPCDHLYSKSVRRETQIRYDLARKNLPRYFTVRDRINDPSIQVPCSRPPKPPKPPKQKKAKQQEPLHHKPTVHRNGVVDQELVKALREMPYAKYLKSAHWKQVRSVALCNANFRCQVCNTRDNLAVHHRTYERRGCEHPSDLTVLCATCHNSFHDRMAKDK